MVVKRAPLWLTSAFGAAFAATAIAGGALAEDATPTPDDAGAEAAEAGADAAEGGEAGAEASADADQPTITAPSEDEVASGLAYSQRHKAMRRAIAEAKLTLPRFEASFNAADSVQAETRYLIKVAVPTAQGGAEHKWLDAARIDAEDVIGVVISDSVLTPEIRARSVYTAERDAVSDWMIVQGVGPDAPIFGGYTLRVMLLSVPEKEAERWRARLMPKGATPEQPEGYEPELPPDESEAANGEEAGEEAGDNPGDEAADEGGDASDDANAPDGEPADGDDEEDEDA